jgi:putative DNA methylase
VSATQYARRLIEVDLPIRDISAHARREKSVGPISTLHIWWARRPLGTCRAAACAALWPDPVDQHCPQGFRNAAAAILCTFADRVRTDKQLAELCAPHWKGWTHIDQTTLAATNPATWPTIRQALLDFIADFANWDASSVPAFLEAARALTDAAAGGPGTHTRPLVADPFAGGGAIPLEALRVGAEVYASDLNPVAFLLNKILVEYMPRFGSRLVDQVRRQGEWVAAQAKISLGRFYPSEPDGAIPVAYLWARTVRCEGPACGADVPLVRSLWLAKGGRGVALRLIVDKKDKKVDTEVVQNPPATEIAPGTVARGAVTCPVCGYTTTVASVRKQLKERRGGAADARLLAVVVSIPGQPGRFYRAPSKAALQSVANAGIALRTLASEHTGPLSVVPDELISFNEIRRISVPLYGMLRWGDIFTPRQALTIATLAQLVSAVSKRVSDVELGAAVSAVLACAVDRQAEHLSSLCRWNSSGQKMQATFGRQALPMMWDFCEANPFGGSVGSFDGLLECVLGPLDLHRAFVRSGHVELASATAHPLPSDSVQVLFTDPPYYDAVPYAHLADFFYVWLRRSVGTVFPHLLSLSSTPKDDEVVVDRPHELSTSKKDVTVYEKKLAEAFAEGRRILAPDGIAVIVFASKTTASWEAILSALIGAGWVVTASWPVDTEMSTRMNAMGTASLASSVHIVCRPRETSTGALDSENVGSWRSVLSELPPRIHEWMTRLALEEVAGADAIFACLGPALEIFSRYSRVEKASGESVPLKMYLEEVWAAVAREALSVVFEGADASGLEEDARLTAIWLWTLGASVKEPNGTSPGDDDVEASDDEEEGSKAKPTAGFFLEFDAARKIAQGLGAHLEKLTTVAEVKGDKARLLAVAERAKFLFGKKAAAEDGQGVKGKGKPKPSKIQLGLFAEIEAAEREGLLGDAGVPAVGETTLDRVHQAMILFGAGRSEALKRFVVEEGVGKDTRFWKLAQSLSALYPASSDEKRWVDGVLARKKSLGF